MKPFMSRHGYRGFRFFLISGRLAAQRAYGAALYSAGINGLLLGPVGLWKARHKAATVAKKLLKG